MVEYPQKREELTYYVRLMTEPERARRVWVEHILPEGKHFDSFTEAISFFFDETQFDSKDLSVGSILKNEEEWHAVKRLMEAMLIVFRKVGGAYAPDEEYLETAEWEEVVKAAKVALDILGKSPT